MDLKLTIGFIASHYIVIFGTTLALFFTACMILLIRSIGNKSEETGPADLNAIEGAMRRVLQSQPVSIAAGQTVPAENAAAILADGASAPAGDGNQVSSEEMAARDAKIAELKKDLDDARAALNSSDATDPAKIALKEQIVGLTGKLDEAQARLAEYEIIEDDIADLSKFKEENFLLKKEIENLKTQTSSAPSAVSGFESLEAEAAVASAAVAAVSNDVPAEAAPAATATLKFEKAEKFELDADDDVMKEFAAAVDGIAAASPAAVPAPEAPAASATSSAPGPNDVLSSQSEIDALLSGGGHEAVAVSAEPETTAPQKADALDAFLSADESAAQSEDPLAGAMDADKMLSEVETLASTPDDGTALDDTLDTDKLLAEVDSLKNGAKSAS